MRVYKVGASYIDLDHVLSIDEPYVTTDSCCGKAMVINLQLAFVGNHKITIPISDLDFKGKMFVDLPEPPSGIRLSMIDYRLLPTHELSQYREDEFRRMKYNIWAPLLTAWQAIDDKQPTP